MPKPRQRGIYRRHTTEGTGVSIQNHLRKSLAAAALALCVLLISAPVHAISFSTHGYYRVRVVGMHDLDLQKPNNNLPRDNERFGFIAYNDMRLRLLPNLKINDHLSIHAQFDILDNVLFGTQATRELNIHSAVVGTQTLPAGAGSFWMTGGTAGDNAAINVRRAWMDILTPIGKFRIGRQPSNWGLGIFQNDGLGTQDDFGDTADRIMWLAQYPIKRGGVFSGGLLWDIPYEAQFDPRVQGLGGQIRANAQTAHQWAAILLYEEPAFSLGTFSGIRYRGGSNGATTMTATDSLGVAQPSGIDGKTFVYFGDLYARYQYKNYRFAFEGVFLGGEISTGLAIDAVPFSALSAGGGIINLPPKQTMRTFLFAFEAGADYDWGGEWNFKAGYAEGDPTPLSSRVTQFGFRPDYQIALMMFREPLGSSPALYGGTATDPTTTAQLTGGVPITSNYINNALYLSAGYKHEFDVAHKISGANWFRVGGQISTAWAPSKNVNIDFSSLMGTANLPTLTETANSMWQRWYGIELDLSFEMQWFDSLYAALEGGILLPGRAYDVDVALIDPGSIVEPIARDKANVAWMFRFTTRIDF